MRKHIVLAALMMSVIGAGCGGSLPPFDPATNYTPESLAQELAFRYREFSGDAKKTTSKKNRGKGAVALSEKEQKKSAEATKEAPSSTADGLLDEIASKIRLLPSSSPVDACKKVAEALRKDTTLEPSDRDDLVKRVEELASDL